MRVNVLFFGMLKDLAGSSAEPLDLHEDATLGDLINHYERRFPKLREMAGSIAMAVNSEYAGPERKLISGDEVGLLPPVSGGSPRAEIVRSKIETSIVLDRMKQRSDGAAVVFEGVVRDNTRGRRTLYLEYESYEQMALKQMEALCEQAMEKFQVRDAVIVHRLGQLQIGEVSVLIVVASAHRGPAFEACRWLIDTLKRTVPIWKKEYFEDGAVWADGEAFPENVPRASGTHTERPASK